MRLKAFAVKQWGGERSFTIYVTALPAGLLVERCSIDRWTPQNPGGYQRPPDERRLGWRRGSALRYLLRELGCFPTSILLNIRGELIFREEWSSGILTLGELHIDDGEPLWVIDGQHRVEALRRAVERNPEYENYPLIVSIMRLPDRFDELLLFYIVNRRQRSVPTDLAYRHLQRMLLKRGVDWLYELEGGRGVRLALAAEVVDQLNSSERSPWRGRIRRIGEDRREEHIIHDRPLIRSIAPILRERVFEGLSIREIADLLIEYWRALRRLYAEAFERPERYTLLGTPGIFSLHMLFPSIYARCARRGIIDEEEMLRTLSHLLEETPEHPQPEFRGPITLDFWSKEHGPAIALSTSLKTIRSLYLGLSKKIQLVEERLSPRAL